MNPPHLRPITVTSSNDRLINIEPTIAHVGERKLVYTPSIQVSRAEERLFDLLWVSPTIINDIAILVVHVCSEQTLSESKQSLVEGSIHAVRT
jgi:hypothetical protein